MWIGIYILTTIVASSGLITLNKYVMKIYGFNYPTVLSTFHFFLSFFLFGIMAKLGKFEPTKTLPPLHQWIIGFFGVASIVAMNYNLKINSVGFYQLSKLCNIPVLVIYKYVFKNISTPFPILCSLGVLLIGLTIFSVNDVEFNLLGCFIAIIGIFTTCVFQTLAQNLQRTYGLNGTQMNHAASFPETVFGLISSIFMEFGGENGIIHHEFCFIELFLIFLTGCFAMIGNIVSFVLLGKGGPVTYQVIGHVKTMTIFTLGLIVFPAQHESDKQFKHKIIGLCISMCGVILYTYFQMKFKDEPKPTKPDEEQMLPEKGDLTNPSLPIILNEEEETKTKY